MTPTEQADLHVLILQFLRPKRDLGRASEALLNDVRMTGGYTLALPQLAVELRHLADKGWIAPMELAFGLQRYRITGLGESKLAEAGL